MEALHASTIFWASHLSVDRGEAAVAVCAIATEAEARRRVAAKRMVDVWMLGVVLSRREGDSARETQIKKLIIKIPRTSDG
jgi:hypothetical protein